MPEFAFYSTEIDPTTDPVNADPAPSTLVVLDQSPIFGTYDLHGGETGRGTMFQTLGGVAIQDFGVFDEDMAISFSEEDAPISQETIAALNTIHETVDGEYYFTDGSEIWRVRFARPNGFKHRRNLFWAAHGEDAFSYEVNLIVVARLWEKSADCALSLQAVSGD